MFKHFSANTVGRDFVVGDIHGMFKTLAKELEELGFDPEKDRLFSVGDLIDRGPDNEDIEEWLAKPWFHAVRGNHEQMLIDGFTDKEGSSAQFHFLNGGEWFFGLPTVQQQCIVLQCQDLPLAIEVETPNGLVGIVHAECPLSDWGLFKNMFSANKSRFTQVALWARMRISVGDNSDVAGLHKLYVGHTPMHFPTQLGNVHYIDTGAVFGKKFTIEQIN